MRRKFPVLLKIILALGDLLLLLAATLAAFEIVTNFTIIDMPRLSLLEMMLVVATGYLLLNVHGLFSLARKSFSEVISSLIVIIFNMFIVMMAISFFFRKDSYSQSLLFMATCLQFVFLVAWNYLFWHIEHLSMCPRNALVIGKHSECERMVVRLRALSYLQDHVEYVCTDCQNGLWKTVGDSVDLIIICPGLSLAKKAEIIDYCHSHAKRVFVVPEFYELIVSGMTLDRVDDIPVFRPGYFNLTLERRILKRMFDLSISIIVLLILAPLLLIISLAVKLDSPGPVFYTQIRSGLNKRDFSIYKFRTMCQDAEQLSGPTLATENDPRITRVGRFLRATRLDELPQFINVFLGDMSVVGPRPERPFFVDKFTHEIPEYKYRTNVKPGITGMAQVHGRYNTTPQNKLIYDLLYIQRHCLITDIVIMIQTLKVLISKESTAGVSIGGKSSLSQYKVNHPGAIIKI